jgi:hypothetical protein
MIVGLALLRLDARQGDEAFGFVEVGDGFVGLDLLDQVVTVPEEPGSGCLGVVQGMVFLILLFPVGLGDGFGDASAEGVVDIVGTIIGNNYWDTR